MNLSMRKQTFVCTEAHTQQLRAAVFIQILDNFGDSGKASINCSQYEIGLSEAVQSKVVGAVEHHKCHLKSLIGTTVCSSLCNVR